MGEDKMSKNLLVDYIPFEITREQINESISQNDGRLLLREFFKGQMLKIKMVEYIQKTH